MISDPPNSRGLDDQIERRANMTYISASIFRRGGQKKEASKTPEQLACANDEDDIDDEEKIVSYQELLDVISTPRSGKEFSAAIWRPHACAAELVKLRKATALSNGKIFHSESWSHCKA